MWLSEQLLFFLAKCLYKTEVAHSDEMKKAVSDRSAYHQYRHNEIDRILRSVHEHGIAISDRVVLDLGCSDGAISAAYRERGAARVVGVDIDEQAIEQARKNYSPDISFHVSSTTSIPLPDGFFDVIVCYDVFEHVSQPAEILAECHRILKPGGTMFLGTWGWYHPFAPHLWATMPVPWAHVLFSERTVLRVCRRVYHSSWYVPNMHDFDEAGERKDKYNNEEISRDYLNKLLIKDFRKLFQESDFEFQMFPKPFGSKYARWTKIFLNTPGIREFITSYFWAVLKKRDSAVEAPESCP